VRIYGPIRNNSWALALHGGAGGWVEELAVQSEGEYAQGLRDAYRAGSDVLEAGGTAEDAVVAAVLVLEDYPLFNAGRGSAVRCDGSVTTDAALMLGAGRAGAIAATRWARNPILAAQRVLREGDCVLRTDVPREQVAEWGLEVAEQDYFLTPGRIAQQRNVAAGLLAAQPHGTVGAVARDASGALAAATSTGGMVNQYPGRIGDSPIIGSGTYARDGVVAVSCTGYGESFIQGVVAHEIASLLRHAGMTLADAVERVLREEVERRDADGGIIAVDADGTVVIGHNSPAMFGAFLDQTVTVLV